ncbi:hypothetical protein [Acetivibrio clariflavus]|uniref:Uncharacterized protein n=1 Tax=Acetivibrio clariflavus (strain DSM 19732 / NBRC 101661 / EBR45) TaxID=720554 RepID=G8LUZ0_ACECE|nr:hypothetical protein [Acetivibrio clariflavus]AEV68520.1 hypothetical protein Clocl_1918 [Acetivibrio clariflavus DSM 19732]
MIKSTLYCLECREYVPLHLRDNHPCPSDKIAAVDKEMTGIVDRLYDMGITPTCAVWTATKQSDDEIEYLLTVQIEIESQVCQPVLGDLPTGWYYGWDEETDKICMLGYLDFECYVGARAKERVRAVARKFEKFLSKKDPAAVKAMLLLTGV